MRRGRPDANAEHVEDRQRVRRIVRRNLTRDDSCGRGARRVVCRNRCAEGDGAKIHGDYCAAAARGAACCGCVPARSPALLCPPDIRPPRGLPEWAGPLCVPVGGGPPARSPHASLTARSGRSRGPPWPCRRPPAPRPGPAGPAAAFLLVLLAAPRLEARPCPPVPPAPSTPAAPVVLV